LEMLVVCNGCVDDTRALARTSTHPTRIIEFEAASEPRALRAGDQAARMFRGSTWTPTWC